MTKTRAALEKLLNSLGESAQFVAAGKLPPVLSGLEVVGLGTIGSPVSVEDAKRMIEKAAQAPFGRGEETILDTSVRRVWQIEPANFILRNPAWEAHVDAIVDEVIRELGIEQKVNAELYKLLIYEPGSFFAGHRDTEKTKNMFATLVICLPSRHEGGTLIVEHDGQTREIDFAGEAGAFQNQYAAFYADCRHEVLPVISGYRVCLVYNLVTATRVKPEPPQNAVAVAKATELLRQLFADSTNGPVKIAIPFAHQYSESGFDPLLLKGADRTRAAVLTRAAEALDYVCHFALATQWLSGAPDESEFGYYGRRSNWPPGETDNVKDKIEMEFVNEESLSLDHWLDSQGGKLEYGEMGLNESELLNSNGVKGWAFRQEISEATGNEGASMEQWYRQAAVVLWPRDRTFAILASEGQHRALPELERMVARANSDGDWRACREFAAAILTQWNGYYKAPQDEAPYPGRMLRLLERLEVPELTLRFVKDVLPQSFDGSEGGTLVNICEQSGWTRFGPSLRALVASQSPVSPNRLRSIVALCRSLCCDPPALSDERRTVCWEIAAALAETIEQCDRPQERSPSNRAYHYETWLAESRFGASDAQPRTGIVEGCMRIFGVLEDEPRLDWFVKHAVNAPQHYDLHQVLIPDVKAMQLWLNEVPAARPAATELRQHCLTKLRAATAVPVEPPQDQTRDAELGCNCEDCQGLARFLRDPEQKVARFPLRQDRRQHLHQQIERHRCDCTHVTEHKGRPYTLVCVKTQASYERRLAQYKVDLQLIADLESLETEATA